jgi:hypothetical protein
MNYVCFPPINLVGRKICNSGFIKRTYYPFIILLYTPYNMLHFLPLLIYIIFKRLELLCIAYLGVVVEGRSEARSIARCRMTLLFLSTLKLARNFAFASWISCYLCSSNCNCSSVVKVSQVGSMILLGRRQSYPLNRPFRTDLMSLYVLSPAKSPKVCWCLFRHQSLCENRRRCSPHRRGRSAARGRTVHDLGKG